MPTDLRTIVRDSIDVRMINDVTSGTGVIIDDPSEVGGFPVMNSGTAPQDSDQDGMPDDWEILHGFNIVDAGDARFDSDGDGYTNLEEYLNGTDPVATSGGFCYRGQGS